MAWLIGRITAPIVSATSLAQLADNLKAVDIKLTAQDVADLDEAGR